MGNSKRLFLIIIIFNKYLLGNNNNEKILHVKTPSPYDTTALCCSEVAFTLINERDQIKPGFYLFI